MKKRRINSARNSVCESASLKDLDWSNWWSDAGKDFLYLHVRKDDDGGGETWHRVFCQLAAKPRLKMEDGKLFWLIDK